MAEHRGWHSRGYLPHWDQPGLIQHLIIRLADSLPKAELLALQERLPKERAAERRQQIEAQLDRGAGSCLLKLPECAQIVERCFLHDDGIKHIALAWCVMGNHVHALLQVLPGYPLDKIVQGIKAYSALGINKELGKSGQIWAPDYFDRFVRDEQHFADLVEYIENNPVAAGLCSRPEDWPFSSAGWRQGLRPIPQIPE